MNLAYIVLLLITVTAVFSRKNQKNLSSTQDNVQNLKNSIAKKSSCEEVNKYFKSDVLKTALGIEVSNTCTINCGQMNSKKIY